MDTIEKLCDQISLKIAEGTDVSEEQVAVIKYGLFAMLHTFFALGISLICAWLVGAIGPTLVITIVAMSLRKYSGGAHASRPIECLVISLFVTVGGGVCAKNHCLQFFEIAVIGIILFIVAFYIVVRKAPVDSIAKPITNPKKIKLLKKKSCLALGVYLLLVIVLNLSYQINENPVFLTSILCIYIGIGWQVFTLTKLGHQLIRWADLLFNKLFIKGVE